MNNINKWFIYFFFSGFFKISSCTVSSLQFLEHILIQFTCIFSSNSWAYVLDILSERAKNSTLLKSSELS